MSRRHLAGHRIGKRAAIRVEPENVAPVRVAEKCGFTRLRDFTSATDTHPDGTPARMRRYVLPLWDGGPRRDDP